MSKKYDVLCIGQVDRDIFLTNVPEEFFRRQKDTFYCGKIMECCGGDAANQSIVLSHLGDHSAFYGRVDPYDVGEKLMSIFEEHGVDTSLAIRAADCRNFSVIVAVEEDQRHSFLLGEGGHYGLKKEDIDLTLFKQAKAVAFGSLFCLGDVRAPELEGILDECRLAGTMTVADMTYDVDGIGPHAYDSLYDRIDYLIPSYNEAHFVTGEDDPAKMAEYFLEKGAGHVIIKLGPEGCLYRDPKQSFLCGSYDIQPVDTTGCGDNFAAGLIHLLLRGAQEREAVQFATACGALNALGFGASLSIHSEQEVMDFMNRMPQPKLRLI